MNRTLSWSGTFLLTRLFPTVWISGFGFGALQLLFFPGTARYNGVVGGAPPDAGIMLLLIWIAASSLLLLFTRGLRRVRLEGDELKVSHWFTAVTIPLSDVVAVRQRIFPHFGAITVDLKHATRIGRTFTFLPDGRRPRLGEEGPVVKELRALCANAV